MRASDQDRTEAVLALSDHFAEGRLDQAEFDTRMAAASEATYLHDLDPLFEDLPRRAAPALRVEGQGNPEARGPRGVRRPRGHRHGGPPFPVAPLVFALLLTAVFVLGFKALLLVLPVLWLGGAIARRRAWRQLVAMGVPRRDAAPWH
jgi:hypothetical protein